MINLGNSSKFFLVVLIYKMTKLLKDLQKNIKGAHVISIFASILVLYLIYRFITRSNSNKDPMTTGLSTTEMVPSPNIDHSVRNSGEAQPAAPMGENEQFQQVQGMQSSTNGLPPNNRLQPTVHADQLLPKDSNSQFQKLNPNGDGALQNINLLQAGYLNGIDTVGSSLRNANLQVRSEPPNPTAKVSPWQNTTIEPDLMRTPLEIGYGPL